MALQKDEATLPVGRAVAALIFSSLLGGGIGVCVGSLATHPFFYSEGSPDWAAVWTMRWTAALFFAANASLLAALLAAFYAKRGVDTVLMTERLKRTEEQIVRFERELQDAHNAQVVPGVEGIAIRQKKTAARIANKEDRDQMLDLVNYMGWVVNLNEHGLLYEELYFDRLGPQVVMIYVALKPLLTSMHESRMINLQDLRPFAVRAFRHSARGPWLPTSLDDIKLTPVGDDLIAACKQPSP